MNQLCKVCGEPAAGFHFGAFTCEGCKSFFGRTYNNLTTVQECKNNGQCVINKKNRTSCKACRLRKCLMVGMSKSGSRYGRRSNWFKIHCLLQEQTSLSSSLQNAMFNGLYPGSLPNLTPQDRLCFNAGGGYSATSIDDGKEETTKEVNHNDIQQHSRVETPDSRLSGSSAEGDDSRASGGSSNYRHEDTPSPFSDSKSAFSLINNYHKLPIMSSTPLGGHTKFSPHLSPSYPSVFPLQPSFLYPAPPPPPPPSSVTIGFGAIKPGLSPKSAPFNGILEDFHRKNLVENYLHRGGGSGVNLISPPLAGVAVDQDEPMDLSVKKDSSSSSSSSSSVNATDDRAATGKDEHNESSAEDSVNTENQSPEKDTSPLDLTKRQSEIIPQLS